MAKVLPSVNVGSDTFQVLVEKLNNTINVISNAAVTIETTANGGITTGNGYIIGQFGGNVIFSAEFRGGNLSNTSTFYSSTNANFINVVSISSNGVLVANTVQLGNASIRVGANVNINTSVFSIGNSTVNTQISSTGIVNAQYLVADNRTSVKINNVSIGIRKDLNLIAAGAASINAVDNGNNNSIDVTISISGNNVVAGANTQIQYNDSSALAASANLTYNKVLDRFTATAVAANSYLYKNSTNTISVFSSNTYSTNSFIADSFFIADFRMADYLITIKDNTTNTYQSSKFSVLSDGVNVYSTEYAVLYSVNLLATISSNANSTHVKINFETATSNNTVKFTRQLIEA